MRPIVFLVFWAMITHGMTAQELTLMTYNIRYDNKADGADTWDLRKLDVVTLLREHRPVVIGLQEALYHQAQFIDSSLVDFAYVGVGRDDGKQKGEFSPLFYDSTQVTLQFDSTFWLSPTPQRISVGWDAAMERICTYAIFSEISTGKRLWVLNTHFDHIGEQARQASASLIINHIGQQMQDQSIIVMGDLNATYDQEPIRILLADLDDAKTMSLTPHQGPAGTWNGFNTESPIDRRIDYIFTRALTVLAHRHIDDRRSNGRHISDHLPVKTVVDIN